MAEEINLEKEQELFKELFKDIFSFEFYAPKEVIVEEEEEEDIVDPIQLGKITKERISKVQELRLEVGKLEVKREDLARDIKWERWKLETLPNEAFVPFDNKIAFAGYLTWVEDMYGFIEIDGHIYPQSELQKMYENDYDRYEKLILNKNITIINPNPLQHKRYLDQIPRRREAALKDMIDHERPDILEMEYMIKEIDEEITQLRRKITNEKIKLVGEKREQETCYGVCSVFDKSYISPYYSYRKACPHRQVNNLFYRSQTVGEILRHIKMGRGILKAHRLG